MWVKNDLSVFHVSFIFNHNRFHFHCKDQVLQMKQIQCTKQKQSHLINYNSYSPSTSLLIGRGRGHRSCGNRKYIFLKNKLTLFTQSKDEGKDLKISDLVKSYFCKSAKGPIYWLEKGWKGRGSFYWLDKEEKQNMAPCDILKQALRAAGATSVTVSLNQFGDLKKGKSDKDDTSQETNKWHEKQTETPKWKLSLHNYINDVTGFVLKAWRYDLKTTSHFI